MLYVTFRYTLHIRKMIFSFKCSHTKELWEKGKNKKIPSELQRGALRKLWQLNNADELKDLAAPPNNRLEPLKQERMGQHSIRINNQWRLCFVWEDGHAHHVEIIDYH